MSAKPLDFIPVDIAPHKEPPHDLRWAAEQMRLIKRRYAPLLAQAKEIRRQTEVLQTEYSETVRVPEFSGAIPQHDHWSTIFGAAKAEMAKVVDDYLRFEGTSDDPFGDLVFLANLTGTEASS